MVGVQGTIASLPMPEVLLLAQASNYRNSPVLAKACQADAAEFCRGVKAGEGRVHECLRAHMQQLRCGGGDGCSAVPSAGTPVHFLSELECPLYAYSASPRPSPPRPSPPPLPYTLRSLECRREEVRLSALQARDMRLRPHLMLACAPELALFCGKEHTGEGSPWPVGSGGGGRSRQAILLSMVQQ